MEEAKNKTNTTFILAQKQDTKSLVPKLLANVPNYELENQLPATSSISASELLPGLQSYHGYYLGLPSEITGQVGNSTDNAMKPSGSLLKSFTLLLIFSILSLSKTT